jgi:cold shock CspA family protein
MEENFMEGKIIRYFPDRRFGYLRELGTSKDWFFHFDDCGDFPISPGVFVTFQVGDHKGREKAIGVQRLTTSQILGGVR